MLLKIIAISIAIVTVAFLPVQKTFAMPELPKNIQQQLYDLGVIDKTKISSNLSMLNIFWAFGLANKNEILESGPISQNTENYASTGGWTLAKGDAMDHYSMHSLITLTPEQQKLVERTSKNIFRQCCRNSAYFPDCNHGMAMLGILELLASQGKTEKELYATAEAVNKIWFPPEPSKGCSV